MNRGAWGSKESDTTEANEHTHKHITIKELKELDFGRANQRARKIEVRKQLYILQPFASFDLQIHTLAFWKVSFK